MERLPGLSGQLGGNVCEPADPVRKVNFDRDLFFPSHHSLSGGQISFLRDIIGTVPPSRSPPVQVSPLIMQAFPQYHFDGLEDLTGHVWDVLQPRGSVTRHVNEPSSACRSRLTRTLWTRASPTTTEVRHIDARLPRGRKRRRV